MATRLVATFHAPWHPAVVSETNARAPIPKTVHLDLPDTCRWVAARSAGALTAARWVRGVQTNVVQRTPWTRYSRYPLMQPTMPWGLSTATDHQAASHWTFYARSPALLTTGPWVLSRKADGESTGPWGEYAGRLGSEMDVKWGTAATADKERWHPWTKFSRSVNPGWMVVIPLDPDGETPTALLAILPARFYMTAHTVYAQRLPDMAEVPIFDATVAADSGSYCWQLTASGPASLFELLAPVDGLPVQLRVMLDGIPFVFAVDGLSRTNDFARTGVRVQGRSVTALIGAPYLRATTRSNATDQTAQQLALEALDLSGVDLDWGIGAGASANGGLTDWLVPAGAWSHCGTPLDVVQAITQAAGGYLQSHRSAPTLLTRHPYGQRVGDTPGAPWAWMTGAADVELAPDAVITQAITRQDGPDINAVYVSGTTAGVLALVKRTSTAGDKLAQMVTDQLITHADAARQRGLAVLGASGNKYSVQLELPVLTGVGQPGVLDVGQLVQINATVPWRGRVRAVSVSARLPTLRQSVTLERHLEVA